MSLSRYLIDILAPAHPHFGFGTSQTYVMTSLVRVFTTPSRPPQVIVFLRTLIETDVINELIHLFGELNSIYPNRLSILSVTWKDSLICQTIMTADYCLLFIFGWKPIYQWINPPKTRMVLGWGTTQQDQSIDWIIMYSPMTVLQRTVKM